MQSREDLHTIVACKGGFLGTKETPQKDCIPQREVKQRTYNTNSGAASRRKLYRSTIQRHSRGLPFNPQSH